MQIAIESLISDAGAQSVAVAFHDVHTGRGLLIHADERFHAASTFKIAVMMEVFHQAAQGRVALDDRIPIVNQFISLADGGPFSLLPEDDSETTLYGRIAQSESLRELTRLMITVSSNLATNLLVQKVAAARVTAFMQVLDAHHVVVLRGVEDKQAYALGINNTATAAGLMLLLQSLAEGQVVSRAASDEMLAILLGQTFNEGIPAGLPDGIKVAHKTGSLEELYHDAAIVFPAGRKPYVLVVLTRGIADEVRAHALVAAISKVCYAALVDTQATISP